MDFSSIPYQNHSDNYTFSPEDIIITSNMFNNNMVTFMSSNSDISSSSPVSVASFPHHEQLGFPDCMAVPAFVSEKEMGFCDYAGFNCKNEQVFEHGEDSNIGLMATNFIWQDFNQMGAADNWGKQGKQVAKVEESEVKIGRYSVEEKKNRILRYLKKRNQRNFNKTIKYACRKTLADKRVRVRGRFAKNNEPSQDENLMKTSDENVTFYDDTLQMICNDDDLLQAAIAGFVYLPYMAG